MSNMSSRIPFALPARDESGHKGTFGTVWAVGGSASAPRVMLGAPALSAMGALRAGAGLTVLVMPAPILAAGLTIAPTATGLALPVDERGAIRASDAAQLMDEMRLKKGMKCDCLAIGPGMGVGEAQMQMLARLMSQGDVPMVIDADGLNTLAEMREGLKEIRGPVVMTPHPGEFAKLAKAANVKWEMSERDEDRKRAAEELAQKAGCVVVLKGARTVTTDGHRSHINTTGNAALATAGSGDVLTGVIAGLIAQFANKGLGLFECAAIGVHVHGLAGDAWAGRHGTAGMLASDLLDVLPDVMKRAREERSNSERAENG
ncbi:MAG TPA: NAD(P)H-hydrate dehydratase [Phycisphaerales bacterium]|nr:NAD(P)H-hydrate dehydratase [Phycisphaerales bacterium]